MEFAEVLHHEASRELPVQEQALATGMLYAKKDAVTGYKTNPDGSRVHQHRFSQNEFKALAQEFRRDPLTRLAYARENIRAIMTDEKLTPEQRQARAKRYTDAHLKLSLKLDHEAFPQDDTVQKGIPDYVPDGLVDMGSNPDFNPALRDREKIKVDKAKIFEQARPLFDKIFSAQQPPDLSREDWKKWVITNVATYVYNEMPYNHAFDKYAAQYGRSIGLHEIVDQQLAVCRHHALMTQVLLQEFGITSRIMKSNVDFGTGNRGAHANNIVRTEGQWYLLDSTNPNIQTDGTGRIFAKPIPDRNIDLNANDYKWEVPNADGTKRKYTSRSNMYSYIGKTSTAKT